MKKIVFISLFHFFTLPLCHFTTFSPLFAEVNLLEPLRAGVESKISEKTNAVILEGIGFELAERHWELPLFLAFRPSMNYELGAKVAIIGHKQNNYWTNGVGDILVAGKYPLLWESLVYPGVFAEVGISLPSGDFDRGFGTGALSFLLAGGLERTIGGVHEHIFLNYRYNLKNPADYQYGNVFGYTAGLGYPLKKPVKLSKNLILVGDWKIFGELKGWYHTDNQNKGISLGNAYNELYFSIGAKYKSKWGKYALSLLLGLTPDSYSYRLYLSARY